MINLNFALTNPWSKGEFANLFCLENMLPWCKNTAYSFELLKEPQTVLSAVLSVTTRQDHAGLSIEVGLFGHAVYFKIYDTRHWDYKLHQWAIYAVD